MFGRLAEAIEEAEVPPDAASLRAALRLLDRLRAKVTAAVASFDTSGAWGDEGATSLVAWLRSDGGQTARGAGRTAAVARVLRHLPVTRGAWLDGSLTGGQVEAVVANLRPTTVALFAAHEDDVLPRLAGLSVAGTAAAMRHRARLTRHHHRCHRPGWQVTLLPDGEVEVTTPAGRVLRSSPPGRGPPGTSCAGQPSMTTRRVSVISRTA